MRSRVLVLFAVLTLLIGFAPASAQDASQGMIKELATGGFGGGTNPQSNFNPYSPNVLSGSDLMFETLYIINGANCQETPWLASAYSWVDPQTLTYTLRDGVTWSDGQPFTANDVVFTFQMLQKFPALDANGIWQFTTGVSANGNQVTLTFNAPSVPQFYRLALVKIVPQHIWSTVADPTTFVNDKPVGTGPFTFDSFNGQQLSMVRNPNYWQANAIKVQRIVYKGSQEGQVDQLNMAKGVYDWNSMFIPDVEKTYVSKDQDHNKYWFVPDAPISLYMNLTQAPFNDPKFREGIAYAINRQDIVNKAVFGYMQPASQTGLVLPIQQANLAPNLPTPNGVIPYDPTTALAKLNAAGYKQDSDGNLLGLDGKPINFTFQVESGWTDWVQASSVLKDNLKGIGINMDVQAATPDIVINNRDVGEYQTTFGVPPGGCSTFRVFYEPLATAQTAPIGTKALSNAIRYSDPATDQLLSQLQSAATPQAQLPLIQQLQNVMMTQFPFLPLWYGPIWFEFRTANAVGWPSADNPYCSPRDMLIWLTHLTAPA